jgi:SPOR domain
MATPINAPMAGEIWHLSIEDLFQPVQEAPRLGGDGPFVINLSVSTAPISVPAKVFAGCDDAHIYQIQVTEDGRTRFRLRLGPFMNEDQADAVLADVRDTYPGALTATASASDLRVIGTMQSKVDARHAGVQVPLSRAAAPNAAAPKPAPQVAAESDAEISIDIAWPTPELVVPAATPPRATAPRTVAVAPMSLGAAPTTLAGAPGTSVAPAVAPPREVAPKWVLPELDIPLPNVAAGRLAKDAPVLTEMVAPQSKPAAYKAAVPAPVAVAPIAAPAPVAVATAPAPVAVAPTPIAVAPTPIAVAPTPIAVAAPVLTEAVTAKSRMPAPSIIKAPMPKPAAPVARTPAPIAARPAAPAPMLTHSVASAKALTPKGRPSTFNTSATKLTSLQHVVVATAPAPGAREIKKLDKPLESLESTQTMRALTPPELEDIAASRWFVIQLALADHAFDPDAVPNLDIFDEYRLYSVAGLDQGRVVHSLRLGFFREEIGAVAVASYLAAYWEKPTIKRVSLAERERFAVQRVQARKDVGATGKHAVIEITDELVARRRHAPKPAISSKSSNQPLGH